MTPVQCRMARAGLGMTLGMLARVSGVSWKTIWRFETGQTRAHGVTIRCVREALEKRGAVISDTDAGMVRISVRS